MGLERKTVLLTGGSGFIGRNLIQRLKKENAHVVCVGRSEVDGVENIHADLMTDSRFLPGIDIDFDYFVHLAAVSSPGRSVIEEETLELNVNATKRIFEHLSKKGNVKKAIFMSSYVVYRGGDGPLDEDSGLSASSEVYARSKILGEKACLKYSNQVPLVVFRLSNSYGPGQQWKPEDVPTLVPQLINEALIKGEIDVRNSKLVRDYIYVDDVSEAIVRALKSDYKGVLNLGTGKGYSVGEVAEAISGLTGAKVTYQEKKVWGPGSLVLDISRLERALNWGPRVSLGEGLKKTVSYYKKATGNEK